MSDIATKKIIAQQVDVISSSADEDECRHEEVMTMHQPYRFVRLNPRFDKATTLTRLKAEVARDPYPLSVPWLSLADADEKSGTASSYFYALPSDFAIQTSECFQTGRIYGQDVSSGAAVAALMTDRYDQQQQQQFHGAGSHEGGEAQSAVASSPAETEGKPLRVLDICSAPGLKLCMIADLLSTQYSLKRQEEGQQSEPQHTVVGVDVSEQRMAVCKRIVHKYQIAVVNCDGNDPEDDEDKPRTAAQQQQDNVPSKPCDVRIRLYCNDGTTFALPETGEKLNLVFDSVVAREEEGERIKSARATRTGHKRKRMNKSARARHQKRLRELASWDVVVADGGVAEHAAAYDSSQRLKLFDRVLVDAECSTDGSVVHVQKRLDKQQQSTGTTQWETDDPNLIKLQKKLAATGFRLLRPGGSMVYSTCSLSEGQNEEVVRWLLKEFRNAQLIPVEFPSETSITHSESKDNNLIHAGTIEGTVRFLPNVVANNDMPRVPDRERLYGGGFFLAKIVKSKNN